MNKPLYTYEYPRPMVTTDIIVLCNCSGNLEVLLIRRKNEPFSNMWALPGGFVDMEEDLEAAALRELQEETGISAASLHQLFAVGTPGRDPRGRSISIIFSIVFHSEKPVTLAGDDAAETAWFSLSKLPAMAFDHAPVLQNGVMKIRGLNQLS